jgi:hypothetical protein
MKKNRRSTKTRNINTLLTIGFAIFIVIILSGVFQYDQTVQSNHDEHKRRIFMILNIGIDKSDYKLVALDTLSIYIDELQIWSGTITETMNIIDSLSIKSGEQDLIVIHSGTKYSQRVNLSPFWNYYQISVLYQQNEMRTTPIYSIKNISFEESGLE